MEDSKLFAAAAAVAIPWEHIPRSGVVVNATIARALAYVASSFTLLSFGPRDVPRAWLLVGSGLPDIWI